MNKRTKLFSFFLALSSILMTAKAQYDTDPLENNCADFYDVDYKYISNKKGVEKFIGDFSSWCKNATSSIWSWCRRNDIADRLDAGLSLSSFGLGVEIQTPITRWTSLRIGLDWTPQISVPLNFDLNTFSDGIPTGNFSQVQEMLFDMTGILMDETVNMKGKTSMLHFKFLVDVYPFQNNRHWHATAGFFAGTSRIAYAVNDLNEKPTLVGLNIYNRAYEYFTNLESIYDVPLGGGAYMDPELVERLQQRFSSYGRMGIHIGNFKDGSPYLMTPAPDGTISAKAFVNHFKPYIGAGYSTELDRNKKWHLNVDVGAIFWGGSPKVINHDWNTGQDINFTKDLENIRGKVGSYMGTIRALPIYPLLAIRLSYSIF